MSAPPMYRVAALVLLAVCVSSAAADDKLEYDRRAAARDAMLFQSLDRDADGTVTRLESQGNLNFGPRFDAMDINRDGVVTTAELQRYIEQQYGVRPNPP
ncbi:MAG: hypothetical protein WKH97_16400 [Casimicrobiaceae bacterium]